MNRELEILQKSLDRVSKETMAKAFQKPRFELPTDAPPNLHVGNLDYQTSELEAVPAQAKKFFGSDGVNFHRRMATQHEAAAKTATEESQSGMMDDTKSYHEAAAGAHRHIANLYATGEIEKAHSAAQELVTEGP